VLLGGSFARALQTKALRTRRLPRTAAPASAAAGSRRNVPDAARRELVSAAMLAPGVPVAEQAQDAKARLADRSCSNRRSKGPRPARGRWPSAIAQCSSTSSPGALFSEKDTPVAPLAKVSIAIEPASWT